MSKRILVCVKAVPAVAEVELDGQFRLKRDGANLQLNISDLSSLEAALRLKADLPDSTVTVLSMGPAKTEQILQELYALRVDRAVLLSDRVFAGADSLATARILSTAVKHLGGFDCILCGRRAVDAETGQIPGQLAAALDIPAITNVQQLSMEDNRIFCVRRLENSTMELDVTTPCLLSLCEYAYPLRLPSIMGRRWAKGKTVEVLTAADLGLSADLCGLKGSKTKVVHVDTKAPGLRTCTYGSMETLVQKIREVGL